MKLDAQSGVARKLDGQQAALFGAEWWAADVLQEFCAWSAVRKGKGMLRFSMEEFRASTNAQPPSHKAWGALPRILVGAGLIRPVFTDDGEPVYRRAWAPKTHAHPVRVWEIA